MAEFYEYAVSDGEGTLLDYGVVSATEAYNGIAWFGDKTLIIAPCEPDCETGKFDA